MKQLDIIKNILEYVPQFNCKDDTALVSCLVHSTLFSWHNCYVINNNTLFIRFARHTAPLHIEYSLKEILYEKY